MLIILQTVCIKVFDYLYVSDLKSLFKALPVLKLNLTRKQTKKIKFFSNILKKDNFWNKDLNHVFYNFLYDVNIENCNKENFMRVLSAESIFEHAFYCNRKNNSLFESCKRCARVQSQRSSEETCFNITELERAVYQKYFKSDVFQNELQQSLYTGFLSPLTVRTFWLSTSKRSYTHADNLVRHYCITAELLFCNFFLECENGFCKTYPRFPYTERVFRTQIFQAASHLSMYIVMNVNFQFFDFFAQKAHPGTDYNCRDINIRNQFLDQFNKEQAEFCKNFSNVLDRKERFIKQYRKSLFDKI